MTHFCRIWLPDEVQVAGDALKAALVGTAESNLHHLRKKYPRASFRILGTASLGVHPEKRLRVEAECSDPATLAKAQTDLVDLAETACDISADSLGMTDDQAQYLFDAIRVERCTVDAVSASPAMGALSLKDTIMQQRARLIVSSEVEQKPPEDTLAVVGRDRKRNRSHVHKAAFLAQEHFLPDKVVEGKLEPVPKRQKIATESLTFNPDVLEKAPSNLQTVRCLLQFLEKKTQAAMAVAPEALWYKDLRARLHAYGDRIGRLSSLRATSGWDARAKRVLDISAVVATPAGASLLDDADRILEKERGELEEKLRERGESSLEACLEKRIIWAKVCLQHDYLWWCLRLLKAREANLTKALENRDAMEESPARDQIQLSFADIVQRLLSGEGKDIVSQDKKASHSNQEKPAEGSFGNAKLDDGPKLDDGLQDLAKVVDSPKVENAIEICPETPKDEVRNAEDSAAKTLPLQDANTQEKLADVSRDSIQAAQTNDSL